MKWVPLVFRALFVLAVLAVVAPAFGVAPYRQRLIIETDAGGDPDDEQSLIRFLLYANEWDVEGIIANRPVAIDGENKNPVRDGLGIVRRLLDAYGQVQPKLLLHDRRFPSRELLWTVTVPGYDDRDDGVRLVQAALEKDDPRPIWFLNWGTNQGSAKSSLRRALDKVLVGRGHAVYAELKHKLRLCSDDQFGDHTWRIAPPFSLWIYPYRPDFDGGRWYHRFSPLTRAAGGFDLRRDVLEGHGPLGALYPTNTHLPQKEGDSLTFLYLVPTGLGDPNHPEYGSWAGRFGPMTKSELFPETSGGANVLAAPVPSGLPATAGQPTDDPPVERNYFCPNVRDTIAGKSNRDFTLSRWAAHIQNDFRARLDWCVKDFASANHPPIPAVRGGLRRTVKPGETIELDVSPSTDPDGQPLSFEWLFYPESTGYTGAAPQFTHGSTPKLLVTIPASAAGKSLHFIAIITDAGVPPLTRYARVIVDVQRH
jgi:hypothetical protein